MIVDLKRVLGEKKENAGVYFFLGKIVQILSLAIAIYPKYVLEFLIKQEVLKIFLEIFHTLIQKQVNLFPYQA